MYDVIGIGRAVKDFIVAVEKIPEGDNGTGALFVSAQFGGKVSTAVAAAARQGLSASMYGTIGKDAKGEMVKEDFEWHGVDTSHLYLIEGKDTPLCIALAEASTQTRKFIGTPADVPVLIPDKLDLDYLKQARCIHLEGGYPVAKEAAAFAKAKGILSSVDADQYHEELEEIEDLFDLFITSEYYAERRIPGADPIEVDRTIAKEKGCKVVITTLGSRGLVGIADGEEFSLPAFKGLKIIDTTGAGDVFHGAFISAYLLGYSAKEAARYASAASYIKCTRVGGRAGIPTRAQVERFLKDGVLIDEEELDARVKHYEKLVM